MFGWEFPPFNSGGLGVACLGLTRALAALGIEVVFVMPKKLDIKAPWTQLVFADRGDVFMHPFDSALTPYLTTKSYVLGRDNPVYGPDLFAEVARYSMFGSTIGREERFDVIYAHDWLSFGAGMAAKRVSGKPLIVHVHATEFDRAGGGSVNQDIYAIERAGMHAADSVIAVSEFTKHIIVEHYGVAPEKVRVVHNGIDEGTSPQAAEALPRLRALKRSGSKIILFLGRITLQKGPDYFLRAAAKVVRKNPNVVFILSGSGDMEGEMMRLAASLGISDRVFFTGFLHDAERDEMYAAADLFVMPSVSEPFGIAPLEAMKAGTPVLISKQSGVSEVVKHALKVDFWDVDEIANKMFSVVGYPGLSQTLTENGRREADNLTWADAARKVDVIMHELVQ
jgi:glycosyltransferase involved in cell wall biosynthesis